MGLSPCLTSTLKAYGEVDGLFSAGITFKRSGLTSCVFHWERSPVEKSPFQTMAALAIVGKSTAKAAARIRVRIICVPSEIRNRVQHSLSSTPSPRGRLSIRQRRNRALCGLFLESSRKGALSLSLH